MFIVSFQSAMMTLSKSNPDFLNPSETKNPVDVFPAKQGEKPYAYVTQYPQATAFTLALLEES